MNPTLLAMIIQLRYYSDAVLNWYIYIYKNIYSLDIIGTIKNTLGYEHCYCREISHDLVGYMA